jgi:hypothetical protein
MLDPITSQNSLTHYRVLLKREMKYSTVKYTVSVANNMVRYYTPDNLPSDIRKHLAMILASPYKPLSNFDVIPVGWSLMYKSDSWPAEFADIGWQISPSYFIVVIPQTLLEEMRGDTGGEGKKENQGNST